jgi:hypothetical protein
MELIGTNSRCTHSGCVNAGPLPPPLPRAVVDPLPLWHFTRNRQGNRHTEAADAADLPEDLARFAESRIAAGLASNVEDALRAGATALEADPQRRGTGSWPKLRAAIEEGDASVGRRRLLGGMPIAQAGSNGAAPPSYGSVICYFDVRLLARTPP